MILPAWQTILKKASYPNTVVVLDFETFFDTEFSLKKMSMIEHITDPRFEILGVSSHVQYKPYLECTPHFWYQDDCTMHIEFLKREYGENLEGCTIVAQNAYYEAIILAFHFDLHPPYIIDVMGLHAHIDARAPHRLDYMAEQEGLDPKGDTAQFKNYTFRTRIVRQKKGKPPKMQPKLKGQILEKICEYANHDVELEWELFQRYLPRLSNPSFELKVMQHTIDIFTHPRMMVDYKLADDLILQMDGKIDEAMERVGCTREQISKEKTFEPLLEAALESVGDNPDGYKKPVKTSVNKPQKYKFSIAKEDPERELLLNHNSEHVRLLVHAKIAIGSWRNHAKRVRSIVAQCKAAGDRLCIPLKYHGAHTGRWAGSQKINLHNLPSRNVEELINRIREILMAPPGYKFFIVDAAQIEARVLAWIAGQTDLLLRFKTGEDVYASFASSVLGWKVRKPRDTDPSPLKKKYNFGRNAVGKVGVLGCGYGMGPKKVVGYSNRELDLEMAQKVVKTYRKENNKIVDFWYALENAWACAVKYDRVEELNGLRLFKEPGHDCLIIELPSTRWLRYHKPRAKGMGRNRELRCWHPTFQRYDHIYGGLLTENVVQAMSRDILAEGMMDLELKNFPVLLTVHDEVVGMVPEDQAKLAMETAIYSLSHPGSWADGCPLAAEGKIVDRYCK